MYEVNQIIRWRDGLQQWFERILWIEKDELVSIRLDIKRGLPRWLMVAEMDAAIADGDADTGIEDRWLPPTDFKALGPNAKKNANAVNTKRHELRDDAWELIKRFVEPANREIFDKQIRGEKIRTYAEQVGRHEKVIYACLRKYWQMGQVKNALFPAFHRCGALGQERKSKGNKLGRPRKYGDAVGMIITDYVDECFRIGYIKYYNDKKKRTLTKVLKLILKDCFCYKEKSPDGKEIPILVGPDETPTIRQFRYWVKNNADIVATAKAREGIKKFNLRYRGLTGGGSTQFALGPGSLYQIDSTVADIYLISSDPKKRLVGRPTLYLIIDVWSRLIVGYHLTFDYPSYISACMALINAACDKVQHCKALGIDILSEEWPSCHTPARVVADRGELKGKQANIWTDFFGIRLDQTPPYRADLKGIVERTFRLKDDYVLRWLPGHVEAKAERGDRDTRLDAKLDLQWLRYLVVRWILFHNRNPMKNYPFNEFQLEADVEPVPKELWAWGVGTGRHQLKTYSQESLSLNLLPGDKAAVTETGIVYKGVNYTNKRATTEKWAEKVRILKKRRPLSIAYDPRCAKTIYLRSPEHNMEPCELASADKHFEKCSWAEVELQHKEKKEKEIAAETERIQNEIKLDTEIEYVFKQTKHHKLTGKSKREKIGDMDATRSAERKAEHQSSVTPLLKPLSLGQPEDTSGVAPKENGHTLPKPVSSDSSGYVPLPTNINRYRCQKPTTPPANENA